MFKAGALLTYMFCTFFTSNFVIVFVITVLLLAFDFWTVKNVSGRMLVGLRWWNEVKDDGSNEWIFESRQVSPLPHFISLFLLLPPTPPCPLPSAPCPFFIFFFSLFILFLLTY